MELIDKTAIVAEIEKLISGLRRNCNPNPLGNMQECLAAAQIEAINLIKDFLDTMEVKEVDLEKEFDKCCENYIFDDEYDAYIARRFFELGLKAQKGE